METETEPGILRVGNPRSQNAKCSLHREQRSSTANEEQYLTKESKGPIKSPPPFSVRYLSGLWASTTCTNEPMGEVTYVGDVSCGEYDGEFSGWGFN